MMKGRVSARRARKANRTYACALKSPWCRGEIIAGEEYTDVFAGTVWRGRACLECTTHWAGRDIDL